MKKLITVLLALCLVLSLFAACGKKEPAASQGQLPTSSLEILETIWGKYTDEEKFSIMGGNMESAVMDAPGNYDMTYAENMPYNLLIPQDQIANVDDVASMIHAMNANTFTCGAFHMAGISADDFAATMQSAIQGNMWMCGFPERLVIASIGGEYVVVAFGVNDAMTPFFAHLGEAYADAQILVDEPIA